jgi:hypothetical protein
MFDANRSQFRQHFGRDPTDTELYMMHQQGLGFYTRGAMTNIGGNPYPGMHGPQTHESFEAGWGRELARRKAGFAGAHPDPALEGSITPPSEAAAPAPRVPDDVPYGIKANNNPKIWPKHMRRDEYQNTTDGKGGGKIVRRGNLPDWGYDQGAWKDMRPSDNIEDRRQHDTSLVGENQNHYRRKMFQGVMDGLRRRQQDYNSQLSKDAGIEAIEKEIDMNKAKE